MNKDERKARGDELWEEWKSKPRTEWVDDTQRHFDETFELLAKLSYEIEASQGNLALLAEDAGMTKPDNHDMVAPFIRDAIATEGLNISDQLIKLMDQLEVKKDLVASQFFGEHSELADHVGELVVKCNQMRWIVDVIVDAAATSKSTTMTLRERRTREIRSIAAKSQTGT
ncbi:MAG: hypothetical protein OXC83_11555 [Chloroflexi bacterium]|nr:hypothetical protein [Chloroflexota bacterium]